MKKLLLSIVMLSLIGCGDASADDLPLWSEGLILAKSFDNYTNVYISEKGNCYLRYNYGHAGSLSKVDCQDFNVKVGNHTNKDNKPSKDTSTELLEYIRDYCVVNDEYESFPSVAGNPTVKELQGKQLSCKLPDNIDKSINERAEYLRLKEKFGG